MKHCIKTVNISKQKRNYAAARQCQTHVTKLRWINLKIKVGGSNASSYSPDIVPSDFHIFLSLGHLFHGKKYVCLETLHSSQDSIF